MAATVDIGKRIDERASGVPIKALSVPIPANVAQAVKNAPNKGIFNVGVNEIYVDQVLKCDEIVFAAKSQLTLNSLNLANFPFVAICAKKYKFAAPELRTVITRDMRILSPRGSDGGQGASGANGPHDDAHGYPGSEGLPGSIGGVLQLPPLYLFGEEILAQPNTPINWMNVAIVISGIDGGVGGRGGRGGQGGNGANGHPGSDAALWCLRGPGDGGNGGQGGKGGPGGQGGPGGDAGALIYAGPQAFLDLITFSNVVNVGGSGGWGGNGGVGGSGGSGGSRGRNTTYCKGGRDGRDGRLGPSGDSGPTGTVGGKGATDISLMADLSAFY